MSRLLVKAIRVRVLNSPKVSLYGTRIIFLMQQQSQVPSGDIGSKVARPRRQSPLNILGVLRFFTPYEPVSCESGH
jgi:hypothetical protein